MAQTTYQVILSTDGKHTVIATSDDVVTAKCLCLFGDKCKAGSHSAG